MSKKLLITDRIKTELLKNEFIKSFKYDRVSFTKTSLINHYFFNFAVFLPYGIKKSHQIVALYQRFRGNTVLFPLYSWCNFIIIFGDL